MELELKFSFLSLQVPAVIELYKFGILFSIETINIVFRKITTKF